jgi:hypothetical protein
LVDVPIGDYDGGLPSELSALPARVFVTLVCLLALGGRASAQSAVLRRPALHWVRAEAAQNCVEPRTLAERVEELVGPVLVRAPEAEHSVEAQVSRVRQNVLRVEVRVLNVWGGKVGERTFEHKGTDCAELTPAIAFVIAMMIDPDVAAHGLPPALIALLGEEPADEKLKRELAGEPPPEPPPELPPAPPPRPPQPQRRDAESPAPPLMGTSHQLAALVRGGLRETRRASLGLELRYLRRTAYPWFSAGGYTRFGQQLGMHELSNGGSLTVATLDFGIQACGGQRSEARLRVTGCIGVEATTAFGRGEGFNPNKLQVMATGATVAQLTARLRIVEPFGVMLSLNVRAALERREFSYESVDGDRVAAFRAPIIAGGIALGPSWEF